MAIKITERAVKIAEGVVKQNNVPYRVWADYQVGQRVGEKYRNRYWLVLETPARRIITSTQRQSEFDEWMKLISENGVTA